MNFDKKIATDLSEYSVSILTVTDGKNHRCSYENTKSGREYLMYNEPQDIINTVFEIWGDSPIVEEVEYSKEVYESMLQQHKSDSQRIVELEEQNTILTDCLLEISEMIYN